MRILVTELLGDAMVSIYNKQGDLIHTEGFYGKLDEGGYIREIPVSVIEYGHAKALFDNKFEFTVQS